MNRTLLLRKPESGSSSAHHPSSGFKVGSPGDTFEQEADRVANAVTSGQSIPHWSIAHVGVGQLQRQPTDPSDQQQPQQSKPNNYSEGAQKLAEAFMQTDTGKKLIQAATDDPLVKAGEDFIASLPGKIITGAAAAGTVAGLAAAHKALPLQIPAIPLGKISPKLEGASVKITYEGPVDRPTQAMITFSYTPGSSKKKSKVSETDRNRAETAHIAADQDKFRAGMTYAPGTPQAIQQEADQKMFDDYALHRIGTPLPGTGGVPLVTPATQEPGSGLHMPSFESRFKPKTPTLLDQKLELKPIDAAPQISGSKDKKEETPVQRKPDGNAALLDNSHAVEEGLRSSSQQLDRETRNFMEFHIGCDFSKVKIHTDAHAAASAQAMGAQAYTVGDSVVFGAGRYNPHSSEGRRLLAHELTHVVQQNRPAAAPSSSRRFKESRKPAGREAETPAVKANPGKTLRVAAHPNVPTVMRQTTPIIQPGTPGFRGARATSGEQGMAFGGYRAEDGWVFFEGPSGAGGHAWNQPGFDGVAFKPRGPFEMNIIDNKSWASPGEINSSSALTRNLLKNLDGVIQAAADTRFDGLEGINAARTALANARGAVASGRPLPADVKLIVTNFGGRSPDITASLRSKGVIFRDLMTSPRTAVAATTAPAAPPTTAAGKPPSGSSGTGTSETEPLQSVPQDPAPVDENIVTKGARSAGETEIPATGAADAAETGVAAERVAGLSVAGEVAGIVLSTAEGLIIGIAVGLLLAWLQEKAEKAALERDMRALTPQIGDGLKKSAARIVELQKQGKKVYARITVDIRREEGIISEDGAVGQVDMYMGVSWVSAEVTDREDPPERKQGQKDTIPLSGLSFQHYLQSYSVLIDDPQKRLREKQNAEAREKLRREAARHPAPPQPLSQNSVPLLPGPGPKDQDPNIDLLPGSPGVSPIRAAESIVAKYKELADQLKARGEALLSNSPSQADIDAFKHDEEMWRAAATLTKNHYIDNGPDVGATGMDEVLNSDRYGGRLKEIRNNFGG